MSTGRIFSAIIGDGATIGPDGDPPTLPIPEVTVPQGRKYSSFVNDVAKAGGRTADFEKAGAVTVAALPKRYYNDTNVPLRVRKVELSAGTAPTGAALVVDVKINGTSVFAAAGDRAKINASASTGSGVPNKTGDAIEVLPGQYVTAEVTQIGSTVAGSDLAVRVLFA